MAEQDVPAHTPHRSTDLTMIDGPKYLYEGYRFQLGATFQMSATSRIAELKWVR